MLVGQVRETPEVTKTDRRADSGHDEGPSTNPFLSITRLATILLKVTHPELLERRCHGLLEGLLLQRARTQLRLGLHSLYQAHLVAVIVET